MKILVVDDDSSIREIIKVYLSNEDYEIIEAENGKKALEIIDESISLIILDVMMPEMNGTEVCRIVREKYQMPILFLSAKSEDMDKISGLMIGADDYITKPFNPMELITRVKAHLRRYTKYNSHSENTEINESKSNKNIIKVNDLIVDIDAHIVTKFGEEIQLTKTEFGILELLVSNKGRVFSLEQIYNSVWGEESILNAENTVSVHIKKLRQKIESNIKKPEYIKTVWGVGYRVD